MSKIFTQIFGLEKELSGDLSGTIEQLHKIGFDGLEPVILFSRQQGDKPKNVWAFDTLQTAADTLQKYGMTIPSAHIAVSFMGFSLPLPIIKKNILMLHKKYNISDFVLNGAFDTVEKATRWAKLAKKISDAIYPYGCRVLYHNHDDEFTDVSYCGKTMKAIDVFLELTSKDVLLQVDIGWAGIAGNELDIVKQYADRIGSIHLKDFYTGFQNGSFNRRNMPTEAFAPIGKGVIATREILSILDRFPNYKGTIIIDQDRCNTNMLQELEIGCKNVRAMLNGD